MYLIWIFHISTVDSKKKQMTKYCSNLLVYLVAFLYSNKNIDIQSTMHGANLENIGIFCIVSYHSNLSLNDSFVLFSSKSAYVFRRTSFRISHKNWWYKDKIRHEIILDKSLQRSCLFLVCHLLCTSNK